MWKNSLKLALTYLLVTPAITSAQSTFISLNDDYYHIIDRYEVKSGKLSKTFFSGSKPYDRKAVMEFLNSVEADETQEWTARDKFNFDFLRKDSWEWTTDTSAVHIHDTNIFGKPLSNRKRILWERPADFYSHRTDDYDIHVNFVTNNFLGEDTNLSRMTMFSGRGVEMRGIINKKLGFYTFVADNQGYFPKYVQDYTEKLNFPGEGLTKVNAKNGVDFFAARGYITFKPLKSINVQFGHDRNFFGHGYRSLALSDNSSPYLFLRFDTQIGRLKYTNLWTSMINNQDLDRGELLRKKKFTAMHHLSFNVTDKLNIGFFEAEVFTREGKGGGFDFNYANPIIFYRFVESYLGSSDNALIGLDFKWLPKKGVSTYGQLIIDEFLAKNYFGKGNSWTKKYGVQLGVKQIDAFKIPNLDLQAELNIVRPYTYSHRDGGRNYMHYKQSLAHPLGANFTEVLGIARYQVNNRLTAYGTLMFARRGIDPLGMNYGSDLTLDYDTRVSDTGNTIGQGVKENTKTFDLRLSYMLKQNLFIDYRIMRRLVDSDLAITPETSLVTFGFRYNLGFRQQLF